jgi:hypothetical protein
MRIRDKILTLPLLVLAGTGQGALAERPRICPEQVGRVGTADDVLRVEEGYEGAPNDVGRPGSGPPGSPDTYYLTGPDVSHSDESQFHFPSSDTLSVAKPGEGAFSFIKATMGAWTTHSFLTGGITSVSADLQPNGALRKIVNVTLGGTTLAPGVLFAGPVNLDLIAVGPGPDLRFYTSDDVAESVFRDCNGLARGVDGALRWLAMDDGPHPVFGGLNYLLLDLNPLAPSQARGRSVKGSFGVLLKGQGPTYDAFAAIPDVPLNGYSIPLDELRTILTVFPHGDLPDIPGFPGSGTGLARYLHDVILPVAERKGAAGVGFSRGIVARQALGWTLTLDLTLVWAGNPGMFDLCTLGVRPCTF